MNHFAQADSLIPGAGNPQAWNRYAYVLNNPLKYNDPSGHDPVGWFCYEPDQPSCHFFKAMNEAEGRKDNLSYFDEAWIRLFNTPNGQHQAISLARSGTNLRWSSDGSGKLEGQNVVLIDEVFIPLNSEFVDSVEMNITSIAMIMGHEATHVTSPFSHNSLVEEMVAFQRESRIRSDLEDAGYAINAFDFPAYDFTVNEAGVVRALDPKHITDLRAWWDRYPKLKHEYYQKQKLPQFPDFQEWIRKNERLR